jgi:hypothetical protein
MIYVTGDTHGNFKQLDKIASMNLLTKDDFLIVLGDFGFFFFEKDHQNSKRLEKYQFNILFVDGNHENFPLMRKFPSIKKFNSKVNMLGRNIFWLRRGHVYEIEGNKILAIGGAMSIDKNARVPFVSWWPEEEISRTEIHECILNLEKDKKFDYIITHTCPQTVIVNELKFHEKIDQNSKFFDFIKDEMNIEFKKWYFGHFHEDINLQGNLVAVGDSLLKLGEIHE